MEPGSQVGPQALNLKPCGPLALIECLDREGRVLRAYAVPAWPVRVGRAIDCDIVLDDPHVAPLHAVLRAEGEGGVGIELGETINGAALGARHLDGGQRGILSRGEVLRLGTTRLRVRLASDPLEPERPVSVHVLRHAALPAAGGGWAGVVPLAAVVALFLLGDLWLDLDPGGKPADYLRPLLSLAGAVAGWALLWSLASKLFHGRLDYTAHLRTALRYMLLWSILEPALPAAAFVTGWALPAQLTAPVGIAVFCALLLSHLTLVLPARRPTLAAGVGGVFAAALGLYVWLNVQHQGQWADELFVSAILPPGARLAPLQAPSVLIDEVKSLQPALEAEVREAQQDDAEAQAKAD